MPPSRPASRPASHLELRKGIIETCLEINRSGLNQGTSGNVSHRIDGGLLITPTSLPYERMQPEDIIEMAWDASYEGRHRPSSEWRFHRDILRQRDDVNVVLHTHSVFCTTLAVHERAIPAFHYMVAVAGGVDVRCAPYACFGTQELSDNALAALEGRTACLLGHHGLIVVADTFAKAMWRAVEVETLARMYVHAQAMGEPPALTQAQMDQVMEQMRRMSYGQAPDLDAVADTAHPRGSGRPRPAAKAPGKAASGKASLAKASPGKASAGKAAAGKAASKTTAVVKGPSAKPAPSQTASARTTSRKDASGKAPAGKTSAGKTSAGKTPGGKTSTGKAPAGKGRRAAEP